MKKMPYMDIPSKQSIVIHNFTQEAISYKNKVQTRNYKSLRIIIVGWVTIVSIQENE